MSKLLTSDLFIEILGAVTGLIYLYFSIRQKIWLWPWGILTSLLYVYVFFRSKFYADMSLQFYYLAISIYGWYFWKRGGNGKNKQGELIATYAGTKMNFLFIFSAFLMTIAAGYFLDNFTDSPLPYWDAFTGTGSVIATWMLARKYIENWIFWIIIDAVSLGTYIYKGLYPTVILFAVYTGMAAIGYFQWKKEMVLKTQN
jgi:nicotinamide mononucleotide transporter